MRGYKTTCDQCGGNDFYITPDNGLGFCYHCGYTTRETQTISRPKIRGPLQEIRKYYTYLTLLAHNNLSNAHEAYLLSRGITKEQIETEKIGYMPAHITGTRIAQHAGIESYGKNILANRIIFPYWQNNQVIELRGRTLDPAEELRYKNPFGDPYYRGADIFYHQYNEDRNHILTEGEIKTLVAERYGFACVGIPGVQRKSPSYHNKRNVYVILDHERNLKTRTIIQRTIRQIAQNKVHVYIVTLPLKGKKSELDTFLLEHGAQSLHILMESALEYSEWCTLCTLT